MTDISYDPFGTMDPENYVSEELRVGAFGVKTLFCRRGCCGDNRHPECCPPDDDVGQKTFETYKLITVIAAGVGGLAIIGVIIVSVVKWHLKKRRLIRDIQAINSMNRMSDLGGGTKIKAVGVGGAAAVSDEKSEKDKKKAKKEKEKQEKLFTNSKKAPLVHVQAAPPPETTNLNGFRNGGPHATLSDVPPPPSYETLDTSAFYSHEPATRAVGGLPVFLPNSPSNRAFPTPSAATGAGTGLQPSALPSVGAVGALSQQPSAPVTAGMAGHLAKPRAADVFATPLAGNPIVFSGPYNKEANAASRKTSLTSSSSSKKSFGQGNPPSHASSATTPLPDIPWDDDDLLLYFTDPQYK